MGKQKNKKTETKKARRKTTDAQLYALAREHFAAAGEVKAASAKKDGLKSKIVAAMEERKAKSVTEEGTGLRITYTQTSTTIYDEDGLRHDKRIWKQGSKMKKVFARIFKKSYNFSVLPAERQKELHQLMVDALSKAELEACTVYRLDVDEMSRCVQEDLLSAKQIAQHATIKKNEPYCTISMGKTK